MTYLLAAPEMMAAAATDLGSIRSTISAARAAAPAPTSAVLAAGADEVSAGVARIFGAYAQDYQTISAQAAAFHEQFVQHLNAGALSYGDAEAANANLLDQVNAPFEAVLGRPLIGNGADGTPGITSSAPTESLASELRRKPIDSPRGSSPQPTGSRHPRSALCLER
jgi:hypothetical protein